MTELGNFIVIEGIDGSGKTTQAKLLADRCGADGFLTREPTDGPIGLLARKTMRTGRPVPWRMMALLFAADRKYHLWAEVHPRLMAGFTVVCDRYDYSSVAYQSVSAQDAQAVAWIRVLNDSMDRPNLTIVLDVDPAIALQRRASRGSADTLYEDVQTQEKLAVWYQWTIDTVFSKDRIVHVDGNGDTQDVHEKVVAVIIAAGLAPWA